MFVVVNFDAWTRQPVPMISEHSAHSTPQPFGIRTWLWRYTYLLLLISMLWHRQAIFESKGDKLSSSAECRIRAHQGLRHQIASRLNAHWHTDWAIEDQAKNLNSTARPYDQRAFSPLDPTAVWHSHLACMHACIHTCMHACIYTCMHAYMHAYIHTYIHAYIHTYIHYIHTYIHTIIHTNIHTFIQSYIHTYIHTYIP